MILDDFFLILQAAVGRQVRLSHPLSEEEWHDMFDLAKKQALLGVAFEGVKKLPQEQWPKGDIVLKWMMTTEQIKRQNRLTTDMCLRLTDALNRDGFVVCILKGQANHVYYDALSVEKGFGMLRICGDIDAWIWPKEKVRHPVKCIIGYCLHRNILLSLCHLHAEVKPVGGVPIEIHFRPSFLNAPWRDKKFQRFFNSAEFEMAEIDDSGTVMKLRVDYDLVFQMSHIYRHLLDEGVGMRQLFDFYSLLKFYNEECGRRNDLIVKELLIKYISACGMGRFASALMFVLQRIFDMGENELLCSPSERYGMFFLNEMKEAGNFGHYDKRMAYIEVRKGKLSYQVHKAERRFKRNIRFLTSYPEEVICEPLARLAHFFWRKCRLYRC